MFEAVYVYDGDGNFLGHSIKEEGVQKLNSTNLWSENDKDIKDLKDQLDRLNDQRSVLAYWPDMRDPDVVSILNDPEFEPLELSPVQVVDDENSSFVWIEEPNEENPFGQMDPEASMITYKIEMAPAPTAVHARNKKACEIVARVRVAQA